jgi:hypothetical protein
MPQQQTVDQRAPVGAKTDFSNRFMLWLGAVAQAQMEIGTANLNDGILDRWGDVPKPGAAVGRNRLQLTSLQSYARTYATRMVEQKRMEAVVAGANAETGDVERSRQYRTAAAY